MISYTHPVFEKKYAKLSAKIKGQFKKRRDLFLTDPFNRLLENHALHGEYAGCRSINVTGDYRAIFFHEREGIVRFINIGTHHELFGS